MSGKEVKKSFGRVEDVRENGTKEGEVNVRFGLNDEETQQEEVWVSSGLVPTRQILRQRVGFAFCFLESTLF